MTLSIRAVRRLVYGMQRANSSTAAADRNTANSRKRRQALTYFEQRHIDHISQYDHHPIPVQKLWSPYPVTRDEVVNFAAIIQGTVPQRIANCIMLFRRLPFVVGCHEPIQEVHELYVKDLRKISEIPPFSLASQWDSVQQLVEIAKELLSNNTDVLPLLIEGISDVHGFATKSATPEEDPVSQDEVIRRVRRFMNEILSSRVTLRLLLEHLVRLYEQCDNHKHGKHGLVELNFSPRLLVEHIVEEQKPIAEEFFGIEIEPINYRQVINLSQAHAMSNRFPYLVDQLEYSAREIIKNALRAQAKVQLLAEQYGGPMPDPMQALVVIHDNGFTIRITDYGSGISEEALEKIWNFNVSISTDDAPTASCSLQDRAAQLSNQMDLGLGSGAASKSLFGYGCGLPISKLYTEMMGGTISLRSIEGYCTNVYIDMPYIVRTENSNRIVKNISL